MTIALDTAVQEAAEPTSRFWGKLLRSRSAAIGLTLVGLFILLALAGPALVPWDPIGTSWTQSASRRARCTGSGPTNSDATCWRAFSPARGPR